METHQLKPAAIGSGREARGRGGDSLAANRGPDTGGRRRGPGASMGRGAARAHPPADPPALPARPRARYALRQARARAPPHQSWLPACRRALWAAGGSRPVHAHLYPVVSHPSPLSAYAHTLSPPRLLTAEPRPGRLAKVFLGFAFSAWYSLSGAGGIAGASRGWLGRELCAGHGD